MDWNIVKGKLPGTFRLLTTEHKAGHQAAGWGLATWRLGAGTELGTRNGGSSWVYTHKSYEMQMDWKFLPQLDPRRNEQPGFVGKPCFLVGRFGTTVQNTPSKQARCINKNRMAWEKLEIRENGKGKYNIYSHKDQNNLQVRPDGTCHFTNRNKEPWEALDVEVRNGKLYFVSMWGGKVIQVQNNGVLRAVNKNRGSWEGFKIEYDKPSQAKWG